MCSFLFAYRVLPQPAPIVRAFCLNVNTIITAGDATAGVSLPVCFLSSVFPCLSAFLCLSAFAAFPPPVLFNSYHYVCQMESTWNQLFLPFASISIFLGLALFHLFPLTLAVMGEMEKAPCCCLASPLLLFLAEALTVLLLTSLGKMDTLTFHTPKCGSALYY